MLTETWEKFDLGISDIEDIKIIPARAHFFGVESGATSPNSGTIWGATPDQFAGMAGDFLVSQEHGAQGLWHVRWDNESSSFQTALVPRSMVRGSRSPSYLPGAASSIRREIRVWKICRGDRRARRLLHGN